MSWYRRRIERDLERWQSQGHLTETGAKAIRADLEARSTSFGAPAILAVLGAVLFGLAVMSFVAANWTAMSKLTRMLLLIATLWACYGGAFYLFSRKLDAFAHAAVVAGIAVLGASIMLIAQMYHIHGHTPDAILYWALGALLAAILARSTPALAATFVLIVAWTWSERSLTEAPHWGFLPLWAATAATAAWMSWRPGLHLAALSLVSWLAALGFLLLDGHAHWLVALIGALAAVGAAVGSETVDRNIPNASPAIFAYAVAIAFAGLYAMQFIEYRWLTAPHQEGDSIARLLVLAMITMGLLVAAMLWALSTDNTGALWLAYVAFAIEIFALYVRTMGSLLNTSLFFLMAALIVSGLAWVAYRLHQHKSQPKGAAA